MPVSPACWQHIVSATLSFVIQDSTLISAMQGILRWAWANRARLMRRRRTESLCMYTSSPCGTKYSKSAVACFCSFYWHILWLPPQISSQPHYAMLHAILFSMHTMQGGHIYMLPGIPSAFLSLTLLPYFYTTLGLPKWCREEIFFVNVFFSE